MNETRRTVTAIATMAPPQRKIFRDLYWLGVEVDTLPHFFEYEDDGLGL